MTDTSTTAPVTDTDEGAVRNLYDKLIEGWNRGSGEAFASVFAPDGLFVAFDGTRLEGREAIARSHQELFDKWMKGTRLTGSIDRIQFVRPDVAVAHAVGSTVMRNKQKPSPERASIQTLVAARNDDGWHLVAFHNGRIRPIGRNFGTFIVWAIFDRLWRLIRGSTDPDPRQPWTR